MYRAVRTFLETFPWEEGCNNFVLKFPDSSSQQLSYWQILNYLQGCIKISMQLHGSTLYFIKFPV